MGMKSAPPQPDFTGAANAQGASSVWNTLFQTYANRPDINTPWASISWNRPQVSSPYAPGGTVAHGGGGYTPGSNPIFDLFGGGGGGDAPGGAPGGGGGGGGGGDKFNWATAAMGGLMGGIPGGLLGGFLGAGTPGHYTNPAYPSFDSGAFDPWTMNLSLNPMQQASLDSQNRTQLGRSQLGEDVLSQVKRDLSSAPDWGSVPGLVNGEDARKSAIDAVYGQASSRLDPQWNQREEAAKADLLNQGAMPGSPLYERTMANFARDRNDAYTSAMNSATSYGEEAAKGAFGRSLAGHQSGINDILTKRGQGLNELMSILSGTQVGMPQMPGFNASGAPQTPDYLGAQNAGYGASLNAYNANQMQQQGMMSGLASMLPLLAFMF